MFFSDVSGNEPKDKTVEPVSKGNAATEYEDAANQIRKFISFCYSLLLTNIMKICFLLLNKKM